VTDAGIVDLSARFGKETDLARGHRGRRTDKLAEDAQSARRPCARCDHMAAADPAPEKIICIGVNYPDRNAEYKDGQDAPKYPSMFMRPPCDHEHQFALINQLCRRSGGPAANLCIGTSAASA